MNPISKDLCSYNMILPALTFFQEDFSIDWLANEQYAERIGKYSINGVLLFGSTGEGASLTIKERKELFQLYARVLPKEVPLYAVLGYSSVLDEISIIDNRISGYLLIPKSDNIRVDPYDERRLKWLSDLIPEDKKIYLYSLRKTTGVSYADQEVLNSLRNHNLRFDGLKLSHENYKVIQSLSSMKTWRNKPLEIMWGSDLDIEESLSNGASAIVSSMLACYSKDLNNGNLFEELKVLREVIGKGPAKISRMKKNLMAVINCTVVVRPPYISI